MDDYVYLITRVRQYLGLTVLLGVGSFLYRRRSSPWVVIGGLTIVFMLLQMQIANVEPLGVDVLSMGLFSLGIAWAYVRYDFITAFTAYFLPCLLWITAGVIGVLAFAGLVSGKTSTEVQTYVPAYITQLAEEERLKRDIEIAQEVQRSFLPRRMPEVEGLDLAAMCLPALQVGGDYYDFIEVAPGKLAVVIGDVSGKGIEAAFYMTLAKGFVQTLACAEASPAEVLRRLNTLFCRNAPRGVFISMIYGLIDVEAQRFTFARAGHNPLIVRRSPHRAPKFVQPGGMAIGLVSGARFDRSLEERILPLKAGDALVLYTDGFSEATNAQGEQFGDDRLVHAVEAAGARSARDVLRGVSESVHRHVEGADRHDDMTVVVVRLVRGALKEPATPVEQAAVSIASS